MAMMECPRCGFVQPKDQFCANCGLNIEHFKPKPKPVWQQLASNPYISFTIIVGLIALLIWFVWDQRELGQTNHETYIADDRPIEREDENNSPAADASQTPRPQPSQQSTPQALTAAPSNENSAPSDSAAKANPAPTQLKIRYYEISREQISQIFQISQILLDSAQARVVMIPDKTALQPFLTQAHGLPGQRTTPLQVGAPAILSYEFANNLETPGSFELELTPARVDNRYVGLEVRGMFSHPSAEGEGEAQTTLPPGTYEFSPKASLVIAGLIPHIELSEEAAGTSGPTTIMTSPDFIDNLSEFLVVIEAGN